MRLFRALTILSTASAFAREHDLRGRARTCSRARRRRARRTTTSSRFASTTDGIAFTDLGAVSGLNDTAATSYLGTRYTAPNGTILKVDATHYGLFFSGGNCIDADSDGFHYVGYAESTDLKNWTIVNGIARVRRRS